MSLEENPKDPRAPRVVGLLESARICRGARVAARRLAEALRSEAFKMIEDAKFCKEARRASWNRRGAVKKPERG